MSPDLARVSLVAVGRRPDGDLHVEVIEDGRDDGAYGPDGVTFVRWVAHIAEKEAAPVWLHPNHPVGSLYAELDGLCRVEPLNGTQYAQGCGAFHRAVLKREIRFRPEQPEMDRAVANARLKKSGDTAKWAGDDITPLVAASQAMWAFVAEGPSVYEDRGLVTI